MTQITIKVAQESFKHDTIPGIEFFALKQITYRFADYCRIEYVREPYEIESFELEFTQNDYIEDEWNKNLDHATVKIVALRDSSG